LTGSSGNRKMADIKQLTPSVVNKIAAGEVIERPASIVKELLENSIDAGASRIDVHVEQGGTELVRVSDNGCGIAADQLLLAVASHATSKIQDADDLFHVESLGFRGEALASISEVSQLILRSRQEGCESGAQLAVHGGSLSPLEPCGCPTGTTVEVRNIFFNTPVRRKFLRRVQTESGHVSEAFTRIALPNPGVQMTLSRGEKKIHDLPPVEDWRDRIAHFYGRDLADGLIAVTSEIDGVRLIGYVADPAFSRSNNRMQYLFLNGRHIRDRSLQHALGEAYRGLLLHGRHPIGFLMLQMPAEDVDVNVHPTKLEVRFQDGRQLYRQLLSTLRETFLSMDLTRHVAMSGDQDLEAASRQDDLPSTPRLPLSRPPVIAAGLPEPFGGKARSERGEWAEVFAGKFRVEDPSEQIEAGEIPAEPQRPVVSPLGVQLHQRYLVTENDEGMVVIDQHALHERILYEQLRSRVGEGGLEKQPLLVPEPVEMTADEAAAVLEVADILAQLSLDVESFGGNTVLVTSYPAMLRRANPAELVRHVADKMLEGAEPPEARDLLDELLHMMACKGAVKAGDPLSVEEVTALLEQRHLCEDAHHCPHGRPTALVFSREELDRRFLRT
jgi:DNA mismatch repair protein MutL